MRSLISIIFFSTIMIFWKIKTGCCSQRAEYLNQVPDQQLVTSTVYKTLLSPGDIPTVGVFPKMGWFVSLTYNLNLD